MILGADTSTKTCSVALLEDGHARAEIVFSDGKTHSRHLMQLMDRLLNQFSISMQQIDALAVGVGPGTFTGVRIGLSAMKGLALANGLPILGISSLAALAWMQGPEPARICPMLDARRGEVYGAVYRRASGGLTCEHPEQVVSAGDLAGSIQGPCLFAGSGAVLYREVIAGIKPEAAHFAPDEQNLVKASAIASLAWQRLVVNDSDPLVTLVPNYLRPSDAEVNRRND